MSNNKLEKKKNFWKKYKESGFLKYGWLRTTLLTFVILGIIFCSLMALRVSHTGFSMWIKSLIIKFFNN